jgi:sulfoxide reductase heme-binding subunit YedZ
MVRFRFTPFQIGVHLGALAPLALLVWGYSTQTLGVNPIQEITLRTGKTALVLLLLSLAVTPASRLTRFKMVVHVRRPLGVYAFLYAGLHFLTFIGLDYGFDWGLIQGAIFEKRYALIGLAAFLLLLPLALTSTRGWQRRLGRRWKGLHRLVYPAALLVVVHYVWLVKSDIRTPLAYGAVLGLLLALRLKGVRRLVSRARGGLALVRRLLRRGKLDPRPVRLRSGQER